ncbi:hypothetical protein ASPZODRAFT_127232 [Penicilliopsis zonata CBS 506.65]|uniref:Chromosome condensation protein n=1 Tax=Penicilliopsis zonata CBS 506.65 TaxID=1073090 RepID=A0A1L9SVK1_9EURO|nr:hypothetical protein ASPZODRAFT_127232 [Penicilliopsis zonata CBS 506.65]OJJ51209.1 hypothetical protein ASPZODRAFT_127232 [Penicilliopsis zonata CBS 506.65]
MADTASDAGDASDKQQEGDGSLEKDETEGVLSESRAPPPVSRIVSQRQQWAANVDGEIPVTAESAPPTAPPEAAPLSKLATRFYILSYLVFFAIFGTLARLGLQALTFYPGAPIVTGVIWANLTGCIAMGLFLEDKNLFREEWGDGCSTSRVGGSSPEEKAEQAKKHKAVKKTIPLYIGLTTGFCGCFTSFSSFIRDVFLALSNALPDPSVSTIASRTGGYSFMALVAVAVLTVSLSLAGLIFGAHLAIALDPVMPTFPFRFVRRYVDPLFVVLGWGCWLGAVFLAIWPPDRHDHPEVWRGSAVFAIVFAPLGCLLRFYVSLWLNARIPSFPLGTFAVNIFGTIIEAMCYDLQRVDGIGATATLAGVSLASGSLITSCQLLQGVMDGFCGSTTTVSTWVAELNGLSRRLHAYVYGITSVAVALGFMVVIVGSLKWTIGFDNVVCT